VLFGITALRISIIMAEYLIFLNQKFTATKITFFGLPVMNFFIALELWGKLFSLLWTFGGKFGRAFFIVNLRNKKCVSRVERPKFLFTP
jgi:hypothetical protein